MGMPVTLALRGRHTKTHVAGPGLARVLDRCARPTASSARTATAPRSPGSTGASSRSTTPRRSSRGAGARRRGCPGMRRSVRRLAPRTPRRHVPRPERRRQGLGSRARGRAAGRPRRHRLLPVGRRRHGLPHPRPAPRRGASGSRIRTTRSSSSASCPSRTVPSRPPARLTAASTSSTRAPAASGRHRLGHGRHGIADVGRHRRHRRVRARRRRGSLARGPPRPNGARGVGRRHDHDHPDGAEPAPRSRRQPTQGPR